MSLPEVPPVSAVAVVADVLDKIQPLPYAAGALQSRLRLEHGSNGEVAFRSVQNIKC